MKAAFKRHISVVSILLGGFLLTARTSRAQDLPTDTAFKAHGNLSGYAFGDYYYKAHADALKRGGANQYSGIPKGRNAFQFRRIYLGYDYFISPNFTAQVLLAAEDANDDLESNKYSFYIKYANIRWKNFLPRTDLVIGQTATPAFPMSSEPIWGYRSIERTIADIRRTPSYDLGVSIQGKIGAKENFGYDLMIGNGTGAKSESDKYKHFYGDMFARLMNKRLMIDIYGDYERLNWESGFHHARSMEKLFIAYTSPEITVGAEGFVTFLGKDVTAINNKTFLTDTLNGKAEGISFFVHGPIVKNKLNFFARLDQYNPDTQYDGSHYGRYESFSPAYESNNREQFITAGLDFTPIKTVHLMPNIWLDRYNSQNKAAGMRDYDLVYRITFYFIYK